MTLLLPNNHTCPDPENFLGGRGGTAVQIPRRGLTDMANINNLAIPGGAGRGRGVGGGVRTPLCKYGATQWLGHHGLAWLIIGIYVTNLFHLKLQPFCTIYDVRGLKLSY